MKEITNKTMTILIVLALLVTVGGTLLILNELEDNNIKRGTSTVTSGGEVTLTINTKENRESQITGQIILDIN